MGLVSNYRGGSRTETTIHDGLPVSSSSSSVVPPPKKKWSNLMPLFVALVVIAEIAFLGRLDMAKNTSRVVDSWSDLVFWSREVVSSDDLGSESDNNMLLTTARRNSDSEPQTCEEWLEREDAVTYARDFTKEPVLVSGADEVCSIYTLHFFYRIF